VKRNHIMTCLVASGLAAALPAGAADDPKLAGLDDIITSAIAAKVFPGAVLIVGKPDGIRWQKAYGRQTYDADAKPIAIDTVFDLASVTKVVGTATGAMALIEDGKLTLDDPVSKHIPEFTSGAKVGVTVRDLLTHVSGLPSYTQYQKAEQGRQPGDTSADALIKHIASLELRQRPRTKVTYSCLNMLTMARVNEAALGGRMDEYLATRVYKPLGMNDTVWKLSEEQRDRCAPTMKAADGSLNCGKIHDPLANYYTPDAHCPGNAGLFSTAGDLARYCTMILNEGRGPEGQVFKPETVAEMTRNQMPAGINDNRGFGWDIYTSRMLSTPLNDLDKNAVVAHTGYTGTLIWVDKKSKTYVVLLANRTVPNGANAEDGRISGVRRELVSAVLHQIPDYAAISQKIDAER
jgi:serine-type D-Ala-D-Ala carboxypeptidase